MGIISNCVGIDMGIHLVNGKIKPKKKGILRYFITLCFILLLVIFGFAFIYSIIILDIELMIAMLIGIMSMGYIIQISPYFQNPNNYYIKIKNSNSFEGFELYYKNRLIKIKYSTDKNGKFIFANNTNKIECLSYFDNSRMNNITKYKIINYFTSWLVENDYLSKDVKITFEKL